MKCKTWAVFFALLLVLTACLFPVSADAALPRLVDNANLLTADESAALLAKLDEISLQQGCDVVIVTTDSLGSKNATEYADDFFDENGYGQGSDYSGILFLISMEERDWAISTCGAAIAIFTDAGQAYIVDQILGDLSSGNYSAAFTAFADLCDDYITQSAAGTAYDLGNLPGGSDAYPYIPNTEIIYPVDNARHFSFGFLFTALVAGVICGFVYTAVLKKQLTTVAPAQNASNYTRPDSFRLTDRRDVFLYRNVTRRAKPQNNGGSGGHSGGGRAGGSSTHHSSSGRSHGGSRGKF